MSFTFSTILGIIQAGMWSISGVKKIIDNASGFDKPMTDMMIAYKKAFNNTMPLQWKELTFINQETNKKVKAGNIELVCHILIYLADSDNFAEKLKNQPDFPNILMNIPYEKYNLLKNEFESQIANTESISFIIQELIKLSKSVSKINNTVENLQNYLSKEEQEYSLKFLKEKNDFKGIPFKKIIDEQFDDEPIVFSKQLVVYGPPYVGKSCWVIKQAWFWLEKEQNFNASVFYLKASRDKPDKIRILADNHLSKEPLLFLIDDIHFICFDPEKWIEVIQNIAENHLDNIYVIWISRNQMIIDNLNDIGISNIIIKRISYDDVFNVLSKRMKDFSLWNICQIAFEIGLDPSIVSKIPFFNINVVKNTDQFLKKVIKKKRDMNRKRLKDIKDKLENSNSFHFFILLLPITAIDYTISKSFIRSFFYYEDSDLINLIESGFAEEFGNETNLDKIGLTLHPFQSYQLMIEANNLGYMRTANKWLKSIKIKSKINNVLEEGFLDYLLWSEELAHNNLDELFNHAEWSGIQKPVKNTLHFLLNSKSWKVNRKLREKADVHYRKLTRTSYPDNEKEFLEVLISDQKKWLKLKKIAENTIDKRAEGKRLDHILYEIAYIDFLQEKYEEAHKIFQESVQESLNSIKRMMSYVKGNDVENDGKLALSHIWVAASLARSSKIRSLIKSFLLDGVKQNVLNDIKQLVIEIYYIWNSLTKANCMINDDITREYMAALRTVDANWDSPKTDWKVCMDRNMKQDLGRHERNLYLHSIECSCWPVLFGLSNERISLNIPSPKKWKPCFSPSVNIEGLSKYRQQQIELLFKWAENGNISEIHKDILKTLVLLKAGGGYEYLGDFVLLAHKCITEMSVKEGLKFFINQIPDIGFNKLPKMVLNNFKDSF